MSPGTIWPWGARDGTRLQSRVWRPRGAQRQDRERGQGDPRWGDFELGRGRSLIPATVVVVVAVVVIVLCESGFALGMASTKR